MRYELSVVEVKEAKLRRRPAGHFKTMVVTCPDLDHVINQADGPDVAMPLLQGLYSLSDRLRKASLADSE